MKNKDKTEAQLIEEIEVLRARVAELERSEAEHKGAEEALRQSNETLATLTTVSRAIASSRTPEDLSGSLAHALRGIMRVDAFGLDAYHPNTEVAYELGDFDTIDGRFQRAPQVHESFDWKTAPLGKTIFEDKQPVVINRRPGELDGNDGPVVRFGDTSRLSASLIYVPLIVGERVIGILSVQSYTANAYSQKEVDLVAAVGRQVAPAIEAVLLGQQLIEKTEALARQAEELRSLSLIDDLTGLHNRRGFLSLAKQSRKSTDRTKSESLLVFVDLDGLKQINDTFGHQEGDMALLGTAEILRKTFRDSDIIARRGGDEFIALAIAASDGSTETITARLQENLKDYNTRKKRRYKLSLSVGVARFDPKSMSSIEDITAKADKALYENKRSKQES